jgi:hypothetical protein
MALGANVDQTERIPTRDSLDEAFTLPESCLRGQKRKCDRVSRSIGHRPAPAIVEAGVLRLESQPSVNNAES